MLTATLPRHWFADAAHRGKLTDGVRRRRLAAFCIDFLAISLLWLPIAAVVLFLGVVTFGAAWLLFPALAPVIALLYVAATVRGPRAGTPGMRAVGLVIRRYDGGVADPTLGVLHALAFYATVTFLTPGVLLLSFVTDMKRTLHDILTGVVVINDVDRVG